MVIIEKNDSVGSLALFLGVFLVFFISTILIPQVNAGVGILLEESTPIYYPFVNAPRTPQDCSSGKKHKGQVRALLIGINNYQGARKAYLRGTVNDVSILKQALVAKGVPEENIVTLLDGRATELTIFESLDRVLSLAGCGDFVFFHYSGLGVPGHQVPPVPGLPAPLGTILLAHDTILDLQQKTLDLSKILWGGNLAAAMIYFRNKGANIFVSVDADFAAGLNLVDQQSSTTHTNYWHWEPIQESQKSGKSLPTLFPNVGDFAIFYGSSIDNHVFERRFDEQLFGQFTFGLAHAIQQAEHLNVRELANIISLALKERGDFGGEQRPVFEASNPDLPFLGIVNQGPAVNDQYITFENKKLSRGGHETQSSHYELKGTIKEATKLVALFVDDEEIDWERNGKFSSNIFLRPGVNEVRITGYYKPDYRPVRGVAKIIYETNVVPEISIGEQVAVFFGNQTYTDSQIDDLKTPLADIKKISQILREQYGFKTEIQFGETTYDLVVPNATKNQISSILNILTKYLKKNDQLIIFYAGHGKFLKEINQAYWLPADAQSDDFGTWYGARELTERLPYMEAQHVLVISDSCFSGAFRDAGAEEPEELRKKSLDELWKLRSRKVLASGANQPVWDGDSIASGHSVFARALIDGLQKKNSPRFTMRELFQEYIQVRVPGIARQVPQYDPLLTSGHEGGEFVMIQTKN